MDKHEYRVKTEQMLAYMEKKQYKKAMEIADTIDWHRVKSLSMLSSVSEIYEYNGENQKSRDILFIAYDRSPGSRKIVYRLGTLAIKIDDLQEAMDCYEEFLSIAPKDPNQYILKYKILKAENAPIEEQIEALVDFKKMEYVEKWAYELAKLYEAAGMIPECLEECDDLILWFSEGKYVLKAMELKMQHKPLTPLQQEKYDRFLEKKEEAKKAKEEKENLEATRKIEIPKEMVEPTEEKSVEEVTEEPAEEKVEEAEDEPAEETVEEEPEEEPAEEAVEEETEDEPAEETVEEEPEDEPVEEAVAEETAEEPVEESEPESIIKETVVGFT
ncbi:tetratricopeptide repeat protein, partial [Faecalimonas sp.]